MPEEMARMRVHAPSMDGADQLRAGRSQACLGRFNVRQAGVVSRSVTSRRAAATRGDQLRIGVFEQRRRRGDHHVEAHRQDFHEIGEARAGEQLLRVGHRGTRAQQRQVRETLHAGQSIRQ